MPEVQGDQAVAETVLRNPLLNLGGEVIEATAPRGNPQLMQSLAQHLGDSLRPKARRPNSRLRSVAAIGGLLGVEHLLQVRVAGEAGCEGSLVMPSGQLHIGRLLSD